MNVLKKIKNKVGKKKLSITDSIAAFLLSCIFIFAFSSLTTVFFVSIYNLFAEENITKHTCGLIYMFNSLGMFYPFLKMFMNSIKRENYVPDKNEIEEYLGSLSRIDKENAISLIITKSIDNKNKITLDKLIEIDKKIKSMKEVDKIRHIEFTKTMQSYLSKEEIKIKEKELV